MRDVQAYCETHRLLTDGDRLVVGVSGGPDSVALLHVLLCLRDSLHLDLHIAHLHHGIRGAEADADAVFVATLAATWGVPCTVERINLPDRRDLDRLTLEEAARHVRYEFLAQVACRVGAAKIAVGHNADDQAETVLMHLLRGAGPLGLRGMLPATRLREYHALAQSAALPVELMLIRPLLATPRHVIEAYCQEQTLESRLDSSNLDPLFFRNRLRHEVLPYLAQFNPRIQERLRNLAEVVRADYDLVREFVSVAWDTLLVQSHADALVFDLRGWRAQPLAVRRALVRHAVYRLRSTLRDVDFIHVENAIRIAQDGGTGAEATLPQGLQLTVGYSTLSIADRRALHLPPEKPWIETSTTFDVAVPGALSLLAGWSLHTQWVNHWNLDIIAENTNPLVAWIDARAMQGPLTLRTRRQGDRFQPQGMRGSGVHLSDLLINVKMPCLWRDHLPLLESGGRILWVVGLRLDEAALVRPDTEQVIYLCFREPQANGNKRPDS
ncbi:MAG: tRNA lysidine(34) synthetase TilS [Anaerolineae bacterium]|nr:tRNA lysidine(34) synthetase TilS [Anaerolineae bacterium]